MATCSAPDCDRPTKAKGLCVTHHSRLLRHGHIEPTKVWYDPGTLCSVAGCSMPVRGRGWCQGHYMRWWRYGDLMPDEPLPGAPSPHIDERFWSKVNKNGPAPAHAPNLGSCWLWTAANSRGRGVFRRDDRTRLAHRIAYEWLVGPIPDGLELDHLCRTPLCVRPDHLEPVTHDENMRRAKRITCPQGHSYAEHGRPKKDGSTVCKLCESERDKRRYAARKAAGAA